MKVEMVRRYYQNIDKMLKLLKPVLEGVAEGDLNEQRSKVLQELDAFVNEARELIESWHHMTSKIYFVCHLTCFWRYICSLTSEYAIINHLSYSHQKQTGLCLEI